MSMAIIQEPPDKGLIMLIGVPGAGKSSFCHQVVLNEKGMGGPVALNFVDAFTETVGLTCPQRSDTICANCADLNSLSIAITKMQGRTGQKGDLLVFDSLTSPYLFNGVEVAKFMRLFLSKFASEGNSVLVLMDEGCGKEEDLGAMMSIADGILRMEIENNSRIINVVKHPKVAPVKIKVPAESERIELKSVEIPFAQMDPILARRWMQSISGQDEQAMRSEAGDFINLFWPQFARWSGMLWDAKRFPMMLYDLNKQDGLRASEFMRLFGPWQIRLLWKASGFLTALGFFPKSLSRVKDMRKMWKWMEDDPRNERSAIMEYLEDVSKTDKHCFRVYENADCTGFENIGTTMASHLPAEFAGWFQAAENKSRNWNAVETRCIGLGDPYCEFKFVPGKIDELNDALKKDSSVLEKIHERLVERLMGFILHGRPLVERPRLGSIVHLHPVMHGFGFPSIAGERYRMALRMGGARSGKVVGKRLMEAGLSGDETIRRVIDFMEHCKVGKVTMDETIRIRENCEPLEAVVLSPTEQAEPCCYFTTGFLNGLFSAVKRQHVREIRCIAAGDPYCEWEIK
jgi:predicted hydrocarbon binding protein